VDERNDLWIPLVDEPIGSIIDDVQHAHPEIDELVSGPRALLAFRTFAYIRVGMLLGRLLVESDDRGAEDADTWVDALLRDPRHSDAVAREVLAVAEEIAADPRYGTAERVGPDDAVRERFREFARKLP
jgi:hypothetical protein